MKIIDGHIAIEPPAGVPVWDIDPFDADILCHPEPYYEALRDKGAFAYIPKYSILACGRHEETQEVFSDHERFVSSRGVGMQDFSLEKPWRPPSIILEVDPPDHKTTRTVMSRAMSPRAVAQLKESFRVAAERLIDELLAQDSFDVVADLAEAYPTQVFPDAVGLRERDRRRLVDYGAMVFNALGPDNQIRRDSMAKGPDIVPWITEQCLRKNIESDGIGATIYQAADNGEITEDQAGMLVRSLLSAGVDTTVTAIGSAVLCLAQHPEQFAQLRAEPGLARSAFDETLRYASPIHSFFRTANIDTEVSGVRIVNGTKILCVLGAANLDENKWPNANRFDVTRKPIGHMALGSGVHACVGQAVARAEGEAVLAAIANKVSSIRLTGEPVWKPNNSVHALDRLEATFNPV